MDQQAQDRCHRIGQTREVHIYRLISVSTIEENILKKANQKRALDDLVIQSGGYNTEFFKKLDPIELFSGHSALPIDNLQKSVPVVENSNIDSEVLLSSADVEAALKHVEDEADYMALKKVEEEEAVDNQEFTEDAIGRLEEDEFVNEDDIKPEERVADEKAGWIVSKEMNGTLGGTHPSEERSLTLVRREEDVDMLADVKQLAAAAAAAGQASSSFENQLRPIDRYAMRFLDLWDPIIDKSAIETQVAFEEEEWELDRIEKLKEDLEAEIDEDEEPLVYETWDADFATEAYRQEVEALAQRQLMEELEAEAKEAENADDGDDAVRNEAVVERKSKSKKKTKKTKFKSLKKGALASESEAYPEEPPIEVMYIDDKVISPDREASSPRIQKKRKKSSAAIEDEKISKKPSKKVKKPLEICPVTPVVGLNNVNRNNEVKDLKPGEIVVDLETKPACRSKIGGKISIMAMPIKRVLVIKPEKLKKKGSVWSKECVSPADPWSSQEDAILCAIVHEYGSHWNLVSDTLYGMTGGGFYRGRFRHPFHCCERFRELCYKYVVSTTENPNNEKINPAGSLKALIKVSEDHVRTLLDVASELPDNELLLQKHFTAIISSVWRAKYRFDRHQNISTCNDHYSSGRFLHSATCLAPGKSRIESEKINKASFAPHRKLVAAALNDACKKGREEPAIPSHPQESQHIVEKMEITLEFQDDQIESRSHLPWSVNLSISGLDIPEVVDEAPPHESLLPELSCNIAEKRLRMASTACFEGEILGWASTTFPTSEIVRPRPGSKSQLLGKHKATPDSIKPPKSKHSRSAEPSEESSLPSKPVLPPPQNVSTDSFGSLDHLPSLPGTMEDDLLSLAMDNSIVEEGYELVSHCFDPNFIAGLDDCELTKQITDIG